MCEHHGHICTAEAPAVDLRTIGRGKWMSSPASGLVLPAEKKDTPVVLKAPPTDGFVQRLHARLFRTGREPQKCDPVVTQAPVKPEVPATAPVKVEAPAPVEAPKATQESGVKPILDGIRLKLDSLSRGGGHSKKIARSKALEAGLEEVATVLGISTIEDRNIFAARFKIAERVGKALVLEGVMPQDVAAYVKMLKGLS